MRSRLPLLAAGALYLALLTPVAGQVMIDSGTISVTAGSNFDGTELFHEDNTLDGDLLEGNQDAHQGTHWLALNGTFQETITFDLGQPYDLTALKVLNTSNTGWNDSETDSFTIATSTDDGGSFSAPGVPIALQDFSLGFQDVTLVVPGVTHVQLVVTNDQANDQGTTDARVGLNEVQFFIDAGADSDSDGMLDVWEVDNFGDLSRNGTEDEDLPAPDGLTNKEEHDAGTDPLDADSDDDTLNDGDEIEMHGTNPNDPDSDDDTLSDADEIMIHETDPNVVDSDDDGLDDAAEVNVHNTDPNDPDTDGDTLTDGNEVNVFGTDPLVPDEIGPGGEMIDSATITVVAGSTFDATGRFDPENTLDGLIEEGNRDAHLGTHWLATEGTFTETITFDLGQSYELTGLQILNTSNTSWNDSETDSFTIAASSDAGVTFSPPTEPIALQDFSEGFQDIPFIWAGATHVQLVVTNDDADDQGTNDVRVGLNEVRFFTGPGAPFEITSIQRVGEETIVVFNSTAGLTYAVDFSFGLDTGWFEADDGVVATGDSTTFVDIDPNVQAMPRVYYRVRRVE